MQAYGPSSDKTRSVFMQWNNKLTVEWNNKLTVAVSGHDKLSTFPVDNGSQEMNKISLLLFDVLVKSCMSKTNILKCVHVSIIWYKSIKFLIQCWLACKNHKNYITKACNFNVLFTKRVRQHIFSFLIKIKLTFSCQIPVWIIFLLEV